MLQHDAEFTPVKTCKQTERNHLYKTYKSDTPRVNTKM